MPSLSSWAIDGARQSLRRVARRQGLPRQASRSAGGGRPGPCAPSAAYASACIDSFSCDSSRATSSSPSLASSRRLMRAHLGGQLVDALEQRLELPVGHLSVLHRRVILGVALDRRRQARSPSSRPTVSIATSIGDA